METILFKVSLNDGREYRVFCANATQRRKFLESLRCPEMELSATVTVISSGIHTFKEWEQILEIVKR